MDQFLINLLFVGASFALYIGIAIWARAGSTADFYAASRGVNPIVNGAATAADWMSAASFISMAGLIAFVGYGNSTFLMGWTGGYVLLAMLLAPYLRKFGRFTVPDFIGDRFYSQTARLVAVIALLIMSITYVIGQMTGAGVAFSRFLEVSNTTGLFIASGVVFIYAVLGGMKGITYTQLAQYVVLIIAYTIPAVFISLQLTGNPLPQLGLFSTHTGSGQPLLTTLNEVLVELGFNDYTGNHGSTFNMVLFTLSLMIGTAGLPHVIIRFFTVPKVSDARKSAGWALIFIALLYTVAPAVGAMARLNIITTIFPNGAQETPLAYEDKPDWMTNWEATGLLAFEDKNGDGFIQYYNEANPPAFADELGWGGNEMVTFNQDILVLANPEIATASGLGYRPDRGRWSGSGIVHGGRSASGHLVCGQPRLDQIDDQSRHLGKGRVDGRADFDGLCHCLGDLSGPEPAGLCGAGCGTGLRSGGKLAVPGNHDGHLQQER